MSGGRVTNGEILRLAGPSILANIAVPVAGLVDVAIAGHLASGGAAALIGGISIGTMLFDILYWNFGFLRVGTGGMTAQAFGRGDLPEMRAILLRGVGLALAAAALMLLLQWPFAKGVMLLTGASSEVKTLAFRYFFIRIWAAPATLSLFALKGWFIGMQDAVSSMAADVTVTAVNIAASLLLALGTPLGFDGIALGTVVAQWTGLVVAAGIVLFRYRGRAEVSPFASFSASEIPSAISGGQLRRFLSVNGDLFVRSLALVLVYVSFTMLSARLGDLLLATSSIIMKILLLFSYFTDGFAYAGEALVGKYCGRRDSASLRSSVRGVFAWSMGIGLGFMALYYFAGEALLRAMTSDGDVVRAGLLFAPWLLLMPLIGCAAFTWDGVYVGATASRQMRDSTLLCLAAFWVVWLGGRAMFSLAPGVPAFGADGLPLTGADTASVRLLHVLMAAYFAHLAVRALYQTVLYKKAILQR